MTIIDHYCPNWLIIPMALAAWHYIDPGRTVANVASSATAPFRQHKQVPDAALVLFLAE